MINELPSINSIDTERDGDTDADVVIIKLDDGDDGGRFEPSFANTQVRVGRDLHPTLDGWLDVAIYHGGDYAEPVSVLNWAHPDHDMTPQELVVDEIMPTLLDARGPRRLQDSGLLGKRLVEAFDKTAENLRRRDTSQPR
ncbi:hypothetical protein PN419_00440 [Halorubrum ezzemoulense]|uniref:hypothetical protein n=1 Tax=Halorubrum ezzemoulense TaxID=337243 RepID=UPI00232ECBDD|nr:hypothetical protein [Halorubrum ezzemoulense]MDB9247475.1 hypothetical protein [Halorubrum ezzemoulense]MDB9258616.1 hypothetical protein [Halorubrum ezzemoulense]MDB9264526.1 hypothetical protein [Halorubrum ezzemoulense]MDB9268977.1 hypothetical protein [Halorubrum ezzemoulense]MDB9271494.1 hypothetical protein [Halorubrum ezzemoulense]